jgi:hypothetical protein
VKHGGNAVRAELVWRSKGGLVRKDQAAFFVSTPIRARPVRVPEPSAAFSKAGIRRDIPE